MDDAAFEPLLAQHVDPSTGKRRVTSLSQLPVPEEGLSGAFDYIRVADIVGACMSGLVQLPCSFGPSREACSCGEAVWEERELCVCTVFRLTFMQDATWHKLRCRSASFRQRACNCNQPACFCMASAPAYTCWRAVRAA